MSQNNSQKIKYSAYGASQTRSHPEFSQAAYQQQYAAYAPPMQSVPSNSGHDMSKQLAAAQPGMFPSSGGMASAVQQHHQPQMGGPVPSQQQAPMVQPGQQLSRGQISAMQLNSYYQRPNVQRSMANMARNPLTPVVNQTGQQPTSQYGQIQVVQSAPFHGIHNTMPPIMVNQFPQVYQQRQFQQYPIQPAVFVNNWNSYNNAPQPNANGYFPAHGMPTYNAMAPQMPQQQHPQQPPVTAPPSQPRSKALAIIDPSTGKNILESSNDENNSSPPLEKEAENDSNICIQFASQVAATLVNYKSESSSKSSSVDDARIMDSQTAILCSNELEPVRVDETESSAGSARMIEDTLSVGELADTESLSDNIDYVESRNNKERNEKRNVPCNEEVYAPIYKPAMNPDSILWNQTCNPECIPAFDENKCSQNIDSIPVELKESNLCNVESDELAMKDCDEFKADVLKHEASSGLEESIGYSKVHRVHNVQSVKETECAKTVSEEIQTAIAPIVVKEDTKILESPEINEASIRSDSSSKTSDKSIESKKNKAKKKKDYNKKGESKEGGEMDAFLDNKVEEVVTNPAIVSSTPPAPPPVVERLPSPVPIVDSEILSTIPLPGESFENFQQNDISPSEPTSETSSVSPSADSEDKENTSEDAQNKIVLKYSYKEDQWSPLNPEGKKQYDRDFLLQLQSQPMSLCKPTNLPNLDVIKDKAHIQRLTEVNRAIQQAPVSQIRTYNDPFMPIYARGAARLPHPTVNRRSQTGRGEKARKVISFTSSLSQSVKLHESENAWKPMYKVEQSGDLNAEDWDKEKLKRSVQGVLNKLTPQKFETLLTQLKNLSIDTEEKLNVVIDLIFEKAVDEPNFSVPYANLCKHLATIKVPLGGQTGQFVNFRKLLLTKCQKEFEQDRCDELEREEKLKAIEEAEGENKKVLQLEFEEQEKKMRYRQLGNIRFIGELFKLNMLIEPIMHECIKKLLSQEDEESLECLCRLLKTIGKELDEGKTAKNSRENMMDTYFNQMQSIVDKRATSSRVRFMLQDIIDLKKDNWVPRRDENNPKTIDQIHKEAEREAREQQQVYQNMSNYPKRMPDDRDRRKSTGRNLGQSEDGWTPSSSKSNKGSYSTVDPSKLKLTKPDDVEGIRLGPGGRGLSSWGRGSSGGTKAPDNDVKTALTNRYSALAEPVPTQSYEGRRGSQRSAASSRESSRGRNSQLPPSIRKTPSTSKERESLLETVKGLTRGHDSKPQDIKKKAEVHLNGKSADSEELILRGPEFSEDEMEKKTKPLVDEFLHNNDFDEAVKCVMELASPITVHWFINFAINQVLERSSQSRHMLGQLLCSLTKKKIITLDQYKKGFRDVLEMLDEFALDIPLIWEYMGEILAPLVEDNEFPLTFLKEVLQPCMPSESAGLLVSAILHSAGKRKGTIKLGEVWRESGLQWSDFLGNSSNVNEFIQKHKLEFTMSPTKIKPKTQMSMEEIQSNLLTLLKKSDENEEIFDWIDANVSENTAPKFIRALVTAVHEDVIMVTDSSYKLETAKLKKRTTLLTRYIDHDETLQLQALYAMQALMNQLEHPSGLLHQIFDVLYDDDVITEDAFKQWEQSDDPNEVEGKGVAVHSSKSFFTWLRESESGDDDANE